MAFVKAFFGVRIILLALQKRLIRITAPCCYVLWSCHQNCRCGDRISCCIHRTTHSPNAFSSNRNKETDKRKKPSKDFSHFFLWLKQIFVLGNEKPTCNNLKKWKRIWYTKRIGIYGLEMEIKRKFAPFTLSSNVCSSWNCPKIEFFNFRILGQAVKWEVRRRNEGDFMFALWLCQNAHLSYYGNKSVVRGTFVFPRNMPSSGFIRVPNLLASIQEVKKARWWGKKERIFAVSFSWLISSILLHIKVVFFIEWSL